MVIKWPAWWKIINRHFLQLVNNQDRFLLLYGGRDSSKSNFAVKYLIYRCLTEPYFRCLMVRKFYAWVKNSQYQNLYDTIHELGLESLFEFRVSPVEVICKLNGNKFIGVGTDDVRRIKSIKDPTGCWYEEDIVYISEADWTTITTSIRSTKARFLQDVYTFNPEVEGQDYASNWFYKKFFEGNEGKLSFRNVQEITIGEETFPRAYTVHHSTYRHNRWVTPDRIAEYRILKQNNEYYGKIYVDGIFGNKSAEGLFYYAFSRMKHIYEVEYDPELPIHLTFDFNVRPYVSASVWQVFRPETHPELCAKIAKHQDSPTVKPVLAKVHEIAAKPPRNRTKYACEDFVGSFSNHKQELFLYGDPAGRSEDTRSEKGNNDFAIIQDELSFFRPRIRQHSAAPNVKQRGEFINELFSGLKPYLIVISPRCENSIVDYTNGKEDDEGRKLKERISASKTEDGISYEKFHHFTDGDDYFITKFLSSEFLNYSRGGKKRSYSGGELSGGFRARA